MHHTISYKDLSQEQADIKAIEDVKFWLGDRFEFVDNTLKNGVEKGELININHLRFACSFIGVQGYPVLMLARRYGVSIEEPVDGSVDMRLVKTGSE
jgi:hypothetical protein